MKFLRECQSTQFFFSLFIIKSKFVHILEAAKATGGSLALCCVMRQSDGRHYFPNSNDSECIDLQIPDRWHHYDDG